MRIAIVHDWLDTWRGGENVLAEALAVFPHADLFALVDFLRPDERSRVLGKHASTSFLQRLPGAARYFRALLPLFPRAMASLDVSNYDLVISISHAVAKGVRTHARQFHVCYCLTPMRYVWDLRETYLVSAGAHRGMSRVVAEGILDRLRYWDVATSTGVDRFIAISETIRERIVRCYDRRASVIYPPVDVAYFTPAAVNRAEGTYVTASRWVPYKRLDLIVDAFHALPGHRLIVAGDGPDLRNARAVAGTNVDFTGEVSRQRLRDLLRGAAAFIFAAEEDFGIAPVEAQACGTPVIAFGRGGATETIRGLDSDAPTGVFFKEQSAAALRTAVAAFEASGNRISADACRANAERFAADTFRRRFAEEIAAALADFHVKRAPASTPC